MVMLGISRLFWVVFIGVIPIRLSWSSFDIANDFV